LSRGTEAKKLKRGIVGGARKKKQGVNFLNIGGHIGRENVYLLWEEVMSAQRRKMFLLLLDELFRKDKAEGGTIKPSKRSIG